MAENNHDSHESHWHSHHHHFFLRWLLGIIILMIVLWVGIKVGELRGGYGFGMGMMGGYGRHGFQQGTLYHPNMMYGTRMMAVPAPNPTAPTNQPKVTK